MSTPTPTRTTPHRRRILGGLLPFIGVILFVIATVAQFAGGAGENWGPTLVTNAVVYMIGWAGIGAGISHIFFGNRISKTIGFEKSPYELEVGFADLAFGIAGLIAANFSPDYWLAVILSSSIFRVGCGIGHIRSMIRDKNFAINNTAILFVNFVVPAFLLFAFFTWAQYR
ncbi:DUF6790 family protein [Microbacterium sp. Leaf151]|jgi:hypothetical protein|uniref:DUF6790 family protein n=1 Tax=Microbacterium sp. Leaf151 TaxID=1736276 RepID=UPI0006FF6FF5|nr:DUF6790 family protein [Microbacterium sp. Leaf151]KQR26275.1 hypothetical protein ASF76_03200 [Microbacterium sp. Leaf151]